MSSLSINDVERIRGRIVRAHERAAARFREAFATQPLPPTAYLEMLAAALLAEAQGIRALGRAYDMENNLIMPIHENFQVERASTAIFEYWLIISEITGSASWRMTRVIASSEEYNESLRRMQSPQIVRALVGSFLPSVEVRDDGSAMLEATVYTRAEEERIERRTLLLDAMNEFHYHGRELIAEGRGGVTL